MLAPATSSNRRQHPEGLVISNRWRYFLSVQGREVEVGEGEISLGRSQSANVSVKDASVSRNHALMHATSGRLTVKDLNSSNGTFLNGMRIFAEAELHDGDLLTLGESEMRVRILPPESVAATMRIDPRALLAGEELRLQAEEEAKAALIPGSAPVRAPLPPPPSAVSPVPRPSAAGPRVAPALGDLSAPASADTGPAPLPPRPAPSAPAVAPPVPAMPAAPPPMPRPAQQPPALQVAPAAMPAPAAAPSLPPLPREEPAPPPRPIVRPVVAAQPAPPVRTPAPAVAPPPPPAAPEPEPILPAVDVEFPAADGEAFALPDLDLPPLPPVEVTKVTGPQVLAPRAAPAVPLNTRPGGFWLRSVAVLLDSLVLSLICGGLFFATGNVLDDEQRIKLVSVVWVVLDLAMRIVGWSVWGTTPGKWLLGLHVFPAGSQRPGLGFGKALLRCVGYWASAATLGIGFLMVAFTKGKRGLHDMIAGTNVGKATRAAAPPAPPVAPVQAG